MKKSTRGREYKIKIRQQLMGKWNIYKIAGTDQEVSTQGDQSYREGREKCAGKDVEKSVIPKQPRVLKLKICYSVDGTTSCRKMVMAFHHAVLLEPKRNLNLEY